MVMDKSYQTFDYDFVPSSLVGAPNGASNFGPDFYRPRHRNSCPTGME